MNNKITITLISILAVFIGFFHNEIKKRPSEKDLEEISWLIERPAKWQGKFAPDFEVRFLDGEKFTLAENVGKKIIILNFFATWCGPCEQEMPELNRFYQKHKDGDFILIGINRNEAEDTVRQFITKHKVSFPIGIDKKGSIEKKYDIRSYPTTVFIGVDGRVALYEVGAIFNADITFENLYKKNMDILDKVGGIDKDVYLEKLEMQKSEEAQQKGEEELKLEGRAKDIAERIYCLCGCDRKLIDCNCKTAKKMKGKLKEDNLSGKTDREIIEELGREFCEGREEK